MKKNNYTEPRDIIPLPKVVAELFSSRKHRLHHALWHGLRDYWNNSNQLDEVRKNKIKNLNWEPLRPALSWKKDGWVPNLSNGSGEDFLFMHRKMILDFDNAMIKSGNDPNIGWSLIPEPGHSETRYPGIQVPKEWSLPSELEWLERRFASVKSDTFYWSRIRWWDRKFHNPIFLRTLTLGELGSLLETSVHNDLHMRWASQPVDPVTGELLIMGRNENDIDPKWDVISYDFLGETYSSQVNPIFWRLHKWVDSIIDEWFNAHNSHNSNSIEITEYKNVVWFKKGTWVKVAKPWSSPDNHHAHSIEQMEEVFEILFPSNKVTEEGLSPKNWF
jgi:hypothetical protein